MAHSPVSAERRAHLIREMARQSDHSRNNFSAGSSVGSDHASNPPNDTLSQQVPAVRLDDNFQLNTSALRRAFPNFSQHGSSDEDSIELGRGGRTSLKSTPSRPLPSEDASVDLSLDIGDGHKYRVVGTPPLAPRDSNKPFSNMLKAKQDQYENLKRTTSEKENQDPLKKTTEYGSNGSGKAVQYGRQTLAEIHPHTNQDDALPLGEARASDLNARTKQSRFNSGRKFEQADAPGVTNTAELRSTPHGHDASGTNMSVPGTGGTHQSFLLPDLPNIAELVSGVRQDGTPLFNRSSKPRSRFGTPGGSVRRAQTNKPKHSAIPEVASTADEKALYVSLQILQEKVANLEEERAQSDKKLEEYELEVLQLRSKLEEEEESRPKAKKSEKTKLERSMKTLQERLDRANRKVSDSETMIKDLTKDRDAAHQQLAVAYLSSEELKTESEAMRLEISSIKAKLVKLTKQHEKQIEKLTDQESELRAKIERREKAVNEMGSLAKQLWDTRRALALSGVSTTVPSQARQSEQTFPFLSETRSNDRPSRRSDSAASQSRNRSRSKASMAHQGASRRVSVAGTVVHDEAYDAHSEGNSTIQLRTRPSSVYAEEQLSRDATFESFMEGDEVAKLRRIVEEDRARLRSAGFEEDQVNSEVQSKTQHVTSNALPRKPSLKKQVQYQDDDNTGRFTFDAHSVRFNSGGGAVRDDVPISGSHSQHVSQNTKQSVGTQNSERRRRGSATGPGEMTSAFILPDITISSTAFTKQDQQGVEGQQAKQTRTVPRPVPVSSRQLESSANEEDATTRPSQPPGLALAIVLKDLEDELTRLRARLGKEEALYHQQDPALSKSTRKAVYQKIQRLMAAIEIRSDQIYALYDVLEGQKANGQTMEESEVEITLQNVGIDPSRLQEAKEKQNKAAAAEDAGSEVEDDLSAGGEESDLDELPWEGFEPTQTQTIESLRGHYRLR